MSDYDYDEFLKDSSDDYPKYADGLSPRRGDRVADCAALEMPSCGNATAGSNPALSAVPLKKAKDWREEREYLRLKWGEQGRRIEVPVADRTFKEVIRLARAAIQPWWTQEYKDATEAAINQVERYIEKNIPKTE
jgi:hypothetical protein